MNKIHNHEAFKKALSSLSLSRQRQVGAKFVGSVLDLTDGRCAQHAKSIAEKVDVTAEELQNAYCAVHSIYIATHPRSGLSELDFVKQAAHFVAEACMVCVEPTYEAHHTQHLAEKVASYCRMARTCANIQHDNEYPEFTNTEEMLKKEIHAQYKILSDFLEQEA